MAAQVDSVDNGYQVTVDKYFFTFFPNKQGVFVEHGCGATYGGEMPGHFEALLAEKRPRAIAALQAHNVGPIEHSGDIRHYDQQQ